MLSFCYVLTLIITVFHLVFISSHVKIFFMERLKEELIRYFEELGLSVNTNTKARGHQGFFFQNRIDISKNTKGERIIPTLLHEFSHFIHSKIEPEMVKTGGTFEILFNLQTSSFSGSKLEEIINKELILVTNFVDDSSLCHKMKERKEQLKKKIKTLENRIKADYPEFMRSKKFKDFDKYIKKSKAKYLLKYDTVKFITPFLRREEIFSINSLERDFPDMSESFCAYIRLKSAQKKQTKLSNRINRLNKYYNKPTELFARFIEGLFIDSEETKYLAPTSYSLFNNLLEQGYYLELKKVFEIIEKERVLVFL